MYAFNETCVLRKPFPTFFLHRPTNQWVVPPPSLLPPEAQFALSIFRSTGISLCCRFFLLSLPVQFFKCLLPLRLDCLPALLWYRLSPRRNKTDSPLHPSEPLPRPKIRLWRPFLLPGAATNFYPSLEKSVSVFFLRSDAPEDMAPLDRISRVFFFRRPTIFFPSSLRAINDCLQGLMACLVLSFLMHSISRDPPQHASVWFFFHRSP